MSYMQKWELTSLAFTHFVIDNFSNYLAVSYIKMTTKFRYFESHYIPQFSFDIQHMFKNHRQTVLVRLLAVAAIRVTSNSRQVVTSSNSIPSKSIRIFMSSGTAREGCVSFSCMAT